MTDKGADDRRFIPNVNQPDRPEDMVNEWREHFESSNMRFEEYMTKYSEFERSIKRLGATTLTAVSVDKFQEFLDKEDKMDEKKIEEILRDKNRIEEETKSDSFPLTEFGISCSKNDIRVTSKCGESFMDLLKRFNQEIQRQFQIPPEHTGEIREDLIDELVAKIKAEINEPSFVIEETNVDKDNPSKEYVTEYPRVYLKTSNSTDKEDNENN